MKTPYFLLEDAITIAEQLALIDFFERTKENDPRPGWEFSPLTSINEYLIGDLELSLVEAELLPLLEVLNISTKHFLSNFNINNLFSYKRGFMARMSSGASLQEHSDDDDLYEGRRKNEKHYSGLLFLTDDYEGGELLFPEFDVSFKPPARSLVLFEGKHHHGVSEVRAGQRLNYILFFKDYDPSEEVIIPKFDPDTYDTESGPGTSQ
jgi:hypothetical protein